MSEVSEATRDYGHAAKVLKGLYEGSHLMHYAVEDLLDMDFDAMQTGDRWMMRHVLARADKCLAEIGRLSKDFASKRDGFATGEGHFEKIAHPISNFSRAPDGQGWLSDGTGDD